MIARYHTVHALNTRDASVQALRSRRLEANDLEWVHDDGPVVRGSSEDLLLALVGREAGWEELSGAVPAK